MIKYLFLIVLMTVVCADHPTPLLDAIINGASRIRSRIKNAGSLFENIAHRQSGGFNFGGNVEISNGQDHYMRPHPGPVPNPYGPGPDSYSVRPNPYGPRPNPYGPGPTPGNPYGPRPNPYGPGPTPGNPYGPGPNPSGNGPDTYGPEPPKLYVSGPAPNGYNNNRPNYGQNQQNPYENKPQENNYNENIDKKPGTYNHDYNKKDEGPTRVPLIPNEVIYGSDKNENISPKRETKNEEEDEHIYDIDIRFNKDQE